jgi:hypothetical protein
MPMLAPTPEVERRARAVTVLMFLFDGAVFGCGWIVAHVTSSIGWGFVTVVAGFLVGVSILVLLAKRIQWR